MKKILLVDDDRTLLLSLSEWINSSNDDLIVLTAWDGRQAITIIESVPIDLLATDLKMPVMDGFELLKYMAENRPGVPAIVMTAAADGETRERLRKLGVTEWIVKPFEIGDFVERIRSKISRATNKGGESSNAVIGVSNRE